MTDDFVLEANGYFKSHPDEDPVTYTNDHYQTEGTGRGIFNTIYNFPRNLNKNCDSLILEDSEHGNLTRCSTNLSQRNSSKATQAKCHRNENNRDYDHNRRNHLKNALEYFKIDNLDGTSNGKIGNTNNSNEEFEADSNCDRKCKNSERKTLGDSIKYFGLSRQLQQLETSLEDVRRNKKEKEKHEELFKKIDKEIQKLSFKYHPDKVKHRGGTEADIEIAQKEQTELNCIRKALKILNSEFMEDIATDHQFEFYTGLQIDMMCDEDAVQNRFFEVILKTGMLSRIKQRNIISEIREFLIESRKCVHSYLTQTTEFEAHLDLALFRLKCCIEGLGKMCNELDEIEKECQSENNNENMFHIMKKMADDYKRHLRILRSLQDTAKQAQRGKYRFFNPSEKMDSYFVRPFVCYVNVILMCNVMVRKSRYVDKFFNWTSELGPVDDELKDLVEPFYLTSYCCGSNFHKLKVLKILGKTTNFKRFKIHESFVPIFKFEIESKFCECIQPFIKKMEDEFKIEYYTATRATDILVLELKKCMNLVSEFEQKEREASKKFKEFQKKTEMMEEIFVREDEMMEEKYASIEKKMKELEDMRQNVKE